MRNTIKELQLENEKLANKLAVSYRDLANAARLISTQQQRVAELTTTYTQACSAIESLLRAKSTNFVAKNCSPPSRVMVAPSSEQQLAMIKDCKLFSATWYLKQYPDVLIAGLDPASHYLRHGGIENRNPGPSFSTEKHVALHPEVDFSKLNPLVHFLISNQNDKETS